jgi:hypothetical protein
VLLLLRYGHFQLPGHRTPRYGLRLGLGLLILATIAVVARRKPACSGSRARRAARGSRAGHATPGSWASRPIPVTPGSREGGKGSCRGWCPARRR